MCSKQAILLRPIQVSHCRPGITGTAGAARSIESGLPYPSGVRSGRGEVQNSWVNGLLAHENSNPKDVAQGFIECLLWAADEPQPLIGKSLPYEIDLQIANKLSDFKMFDRSN